MNWKGFAARVLVPVLPWRELPMTFALMVAGAAVAGLYGALHDQVTYTIGPEYFTRMKFDQFAWAEPEGVHPRIFAAVIGFLATWWVGALVVWILARVSLWHEFRLPPLREMVRAFMIVFLVAMATAAGGWLWGQWRKRTGYDEAWHSLMIPFGVERPEEFMTVAYIHNASYLGGMLGTVAALVYLAVARRRRRP